MINIEDPVFDQWYGEGKVINKHEDKYGCKQDGMHYCDITYTIKFKNKTIQATEEQTEDMIQAYKRIVLTRKGNLK